MNTQADIYTEERPSMRISVRELVEFLLRSGDIDDRAGVMDSVAAMQAGSRIHRKLQKKSGVSYHAEVPLKFVVDYTEYTLGIEGRADGIIFTDDEDGRPDPAHDVTIDEIKGMYQDVMEMEAPVPVHLAQAKCYAYFFATQHDLDSINVQMTYVNLDTEEIHRFKNTYEIDDLEHWFCCLIDSYRKWSDFRYHWQTTRNESIHRLEFPFEYRPGQKELAADVYRTIAREAVLFIQAPTGAGKTISTLFPAVKAVGEHKIGQIFYLTAKTVTRQVARDTFALFEERGYRGKTVEINAKDKMCLIEERSCNPEDCPYAAGHFDRVNDAVYDILNETDLFDRDTILNRAGERRVCPYELSLDLASWADNILCDYNYVFDPNVALPGFFGEGRRGDYLFLVDEAHNLVERAREMYSETLYKEDFLSIRRWFRTRNKKIASSAGKCNSMMLSWKKETGEYQILDGIDDFVFALMRLAGALEEFLDERRPIPEQDDLIEIYFRIRCFLTITDWIDERYRIYCEQSEDGRFALHLFCIDPSLLLTQKMKQGKSCILFSATLLPVNYYKKLLCSVENPYAVYAKSVFLPSQWRIIIGSDVTTRYKMRTDEMYHRYADYITEITKCHSGNYMVFCPSYRVMNEVLDRFLVTAPEGMRVIAQESHMTEQDRDNFLEEFRTTHKETLVAFCVLGGIFAEGIDLTGNQLIGAIIIGTGLPQVNHKSKILCDYFDRTEHAGFNYAYLYPGMNKVQQAAGRVIRTVDDRGIIALLDDRFLYREYQASFPREWSDYDVCRVETVKEAVTSFWSVTPQEEDQEKLLPQR